MTRLVPTATHWYDRLLRLCARDLYAEFGDEMALVFSDDLTDSYQHGGRMAAFRVCLRAAAELSCLAARSALSVHGVLTGLLSGAVTFLSVAAELALARAHGPTPITAAPAYVLFLMVLIPSCVAAVVGFIAARLPLRTTPQRLLD